MKVAFVGKGGSGKTTLSALFCHYLASLLCPVLAFDADINQHLGEALGLSEEEVRCLPALGLDMERIKDYLRGTNPRLAKTALMAKTTPPGHGSRLWSVREGNPLVSHFGRSVQGVTVLATGPFQEEDLGLKCYHSKVGAIELLLSHCVEGPDEYVIVDMTAGADSFASGLFVKFDLTFLIVEPTKKSLDVYQQYTRYARDYAVKIAVIGNKVECSEDIAFLQDRVGDDLLTWVEQSRFVRAAEKGCSEHFACLEPINVNALVTMKQAIDQCEQNWARFYQDTVDFHRKNAVSWLNTALGEDVSMQIDPDFSLAAWVGKQTKQTNLS